MNGPMTARRAAAAAGLVSLLVASGHARLDAQPGGGTTSVAAQDPAWAPDGRRVAVSSLDTIWTMAPDGQKPAPLVAAALPGVEREQRKQ